MVGLGGGMGMDGALCLGLYLSLTHPRRWGTCTKRRGARTPCTHSFLARTRGYMVELISVRKGSPRGNLTRVLVVHLMEGGSSTTGEQTNCDLTRYVKKEANHVGPTLEARLYTLEHFLCVPSTRRTRRSLLSMPSPPPTGMVARRMR